MSFFIRNNKSKVHPKTNNLKRKGKVSFDHGKKKKSKSTVKEAEKYDSDEILSEDDVDDNNEVEEDIQISAQDKKLELAKKYLEDLANQEREKLDTNELDNKVLLSRLRDDVLEQAGKLRRKVAEKLQETSDITVLRCKEHKLSITCVVVSPDNKHLYSASKDCSIVKWCLKQKKKLKSIPPKQKCKDKEYLHDSPILCLAASYDNKFLASGDESNGIRIWNATTLEHVTTLMGHRGAVTGLAFCKYTPTLYSCARDRSVKLWNIHDMGYIETLFGHQAVITAIDVMGKDRAVSSGGTDNSVRLWKIPEETQLVFNASCRSVDAIKRLDEQHFVTGSDDGELSVWGTLKKKPLHSVKKSHGVDTSSNEPNWVASVATLSNTEVFASGSNDGFIRLWKCSDNYRGVTPLFQVAVTGFVNSLVFTPDEKYLVAGVGQEHRLGRWSRMKEARNSIVIINVHSSSEEETGSED